MRTHLIEGATASLTEIPEPSLEMTLLPKGLALGEADVRVSGSEPEEGILIR